MNEQIRKWVSLLPIAFFTVFLIDCLNEGDWIWAAIAVVTLTYLLRSAWKAWRPMRLS